MRRTEETNEVVIFTHSAAGGTILSDCRSRVGYAVLILTLVITHPEE